MVFKDEIDLLVRKVSNIETVQKTMARDLQPMYIEWCDKKQFRMDQEMLVAYG